ncbi:MAG: Xaa-Pro peptidase family protein [Caldimicrobium sp.]|nr:Xaa-Pro peptidase family protein [Caldimicrobium sp.]MCX7613948.1 Xaa-Pro peptidase family protein [Caldimicrobium sp.]MDW8183356.1 Xaa-Pro peptidase family protein [Caldimicrobium sp.]
MVKEEIEKRIYKLKSLLKEGELGGALVFSPLNIFYLTGQWISGCLLISEKKTLLLSKRPKSSPGLKGGYFDFRAIKSYREIPTILEDLSLKDVALEYGAFSLSEGEDVRRLFSGFNVRPLDSLIWELRMIKSPREILYQKKAGSLLRRALIKSLRHIKPGQREIRSSAILEYHLRDLGHPGYTRSSHSFELTYGYFISGKEGLFPVIFSTGEGGKGLPGFPGGASFKRLKRNEPILLDFSGFYRGYYVDQTRMASFGEVKEAEPFYKASLEILLTLEARALPGVPCAELFEIAFDIATKWGIRDHLMCHGEPLPFVGHGVGLQIDEPPVISSKNTRPLEENMVIALEPKFHVPELGVIGLEDTFWVTKRGLRRLTPFPRDWIYLD